MAAHAKDSRRRRRKPPGKLGKTVRIVLIILGILLLLSVIGNFLPQAKAAGPPPAQHPAEVAMLENPHAAAIDAGKTEVPYWYTQGHIQAVVRGDSVLFANLGTGPSSSVFSFVQLHTPGVRTAYNVWTGTTASVGGMKITLPPGGTALYVLK